MWAKIRNNWELKIRNKELFASHDVFSVEKWHFLISISQFIMKKCLPLQQKSKK